MTYNFHVDQIGSFLRPEELLLARRKQKKGEITQEALSKLEDQHIKALVEKQISHGLKVVTDGEYRRDLFTDVFLGWNGIEAKSFPGGVSIPGAEDLRFPSVVGKVSANANHPELGHFDYLKSITPSGITPKVVVAPPSMLFPSFPGPGGFKGAPAPAPYTSYDDLYADLSKAFRDTLLQFYQHGCRCIQIDEAAFLTHPYLFFKDNEKIQWEYFDHMVDAAWKTLGPALKDLPTDLNILLHICRGNNKLFTTQLNRPLPGYKESIDFIKNVNPVAALLEYDDERSGSFEPLQKIHQLLPNTRILLGIVTTKTGKLESEELMEARIREATKFVPLESLGICPQCGFATEKGGNYINEEEQWAKIDLIVKLAKKIWGSA